MHAQGIPVHIFNALLCTLYVNLRVFYVFVCTSSSSNSLRSQAERGDERPLDALEFKKKTEVGPLDAMGCNQKKAEVLPLDALDFKSKRTVE